MHCIHIFWPRKMCWKYVTYSPTNCIQTWFDKIHHLFKIQVTRAALILCSAHVVCISGSQIRNISKLRAGWAIDTNFWSISSFWNRGIWVKILNRFTFHSQIDLRSRLECFYRTQGSTSFSNWRTKFVKCKW